MSEIRYLSDIAEEYRAKTGKEPSLMEYARLVRKWQAKRVMGQVDWVLANDITSIHNTVQKPLGMFTEGLTPEQWAAHKAGEDVPATPFLARKFNKYIEGLTGGYVSSPGVEPEDPGFIEKATDAFSHVAGMVTPTGALGKTLGLPGKAGALAKSSTGLGLYELLKKGGGLKDAALGGLIGGAFAAAPMLRVALGAKMAGPVGKALTSAGKVSHAADAAGMGFGLAKAEGMPTEDAAAAALGMAAVGPAIGGLGPFKAPQRKVPQYAAADPAPQFGELLSPPKRPVFLEDLSSGRILRKGEGAALKTAREAALKPLKGAGKADEAVSAYRRSGNIEDLVRRLPENPEDGVSPEFKRGIKVKGIKKRTNPRAAQILDRRRLLKGLGKGAPININKVDRSILQSNKNTEEMMFEMGDQWRAAAEERVVSKSGMSRKSKDWDLVGRVLDVIPNEVAYGVQMPAEVTAKVKKIVGSRKNSMEIVTTAKRMRRAMNEMREQANMVHRKTGQEEVGEIDAYAPAILRNRLRDNVVDAVTGRETPDFARKGGFKIPKYKPKKKQAVNPRAMKRKKHGIPENRREYNALKIMDNYIDNMSRDIGHSVAIHNNRGHAKVLREAGYEDAARVIDDYTDGTYLRERQGIAGALDNFMESARGTRVLKNAFLLPVRRGLNNAVFMGNFVWTTGIQVTSLSLNPWRYGTRASLEMFRLSRSPEFRKLMSEYGPNIRMKRRSGGRLFFQDIDKMPTGSERLSPAAKGDQTKRALRWFTDYVENELNMASAAAAWQHGRRAGLTGKELLLFADEGAAFTQSMYDHYNKVSLLRGQTFSALVPFQSFPFEVYNTIREAFGRTGEYSAIGRSKFTGKATRNQEIGRRVGIAFRMMAYTMLVNAIWERSHGRKPFDFRVGPGGPSTIPLWSVMAGGGFSPDYPSQREGKLLPAQYTESLSSALKYLGKYGSSKKLVRHLMGYHLPAGAQANRILRALEAIENDGWVTHLEKRDGKVRTVKEYKIQEDEYLMALLMGPGKTPSGRKYWDSRKKK